MAAAICPRGQVQTAGRPRGPAKSSAFAVHIVPRTRVLAIDFAACIALPTCYALSGTDLLYAATSLPTTSGSSSRTSSRTVPVWSYACATRCPCLGRVRRCTAKSNRKTDTLRTTCARNLALRLLISGRFFQALEHADQEVCGLSAPPRGARAVSFRFGRPKLTVEVYRQAVAFPFSRLWVAIQPSVPLHCSQ
eukprot:3475600-Rhodomonas_salina.2